MSPEPSCWSSTFCIVLRSIDCNKRITMETIQLTARLGKGEAAMMSFRKSGKLVIHTVDSVIVTKQCQFCADHA